MINLTLFYKEKHLIGICLHFQSLSPLPSWQEAWWYTWCWSSHWEKNLQAKRERLGEWAWFSMAFEISKSMWEWTSSLHNPTLPKPSNSFKEFHFPVDYLFKYRSLRGYSYANYHSAQRSCCLRKLLVRTTDPEVHCWGDALAQSLPTTTPEKSVFTSKASLLS